MTSYVVFDLETVPDLDIARRLLNLGADVPNEEVRSAIGQKYARPDQDPREIFLKPLFHRIVCIGAVFAERDHDGPFSVRSIGARHVGEKDEPKLIGDFLAGLPRDDGGSGPVSSASTAAASTCRCCATGRFPSAYPFLACFTVAAAITGIASAAITSTCATCFPASGRLHGQA